MVCGQNLQLEVQLCHSLFDIDDFSAGAGGQGNKNDRQHFEELGEALQATPNCLPQTYSLYRSLNFDS